MRARGVETIPLRELGIGDVVLFDQPLPKRGHQVMRVQSQTVQPGTPQVSVGSVVLYGPTIDLPPVGSPSFEGAVPTEITRVGTTSVTRLVPSDLVTGYMNRLRSAWGDGLTYQLGGTDDIPGPALHAEKGFALHDLLPRRDLLTDARPGGIEQLAQLSQTGWRPITSTSERVRPDVEIVTLAAPHPDIPEACQLVSLVRRQTQETWSCRIVDSPVVAIPAKAARRAGLMLVWSTQQTAPCGVTPALQLTVTNTAAHRWVNVGGDHDWAFAWVLDAQGARMTDTGLHSSVHSVSYLRSLAPGQSVTVSDVAILTPNADQLEAGDYGLEGLVPSIGLSTSKNGYLNISV
jgi:hypothetical protein